MPSTSTAILGITLASPGSVHFIGSQRPFETRSHSVAISLLNLTCALRKFYLYPASLKWEILRCITIKAIHNKIVNPEAI